MRETFCSAFIKIVGVKSVSLYEILNDITIYENNGYNKILKKKEHKYIYSIKNQAMEL